MGGGRDRGTWTARKLRYKTRGVENNSKNYIMQMIRLANTETLVRLEFIGRINDKFNQKIFFYKGVK